MRLIYLCGGIHGLADTECKTWRDQAVAGLPADLCLNPLWRDYRGQEAGRAWDIVSDDLAAIDKADLLLVNAIRPSWGTAMEVRVAHQQRKQVVAFNVPERPSPWLEYHTTERFGTLDEAIAYLWEAA